MQNNSYICYDNITNINQMKNVSTSIELMLFFYFSLHSDQNFKLLNKCLRYFLAT